MTKRLTRNPADGMIGGVAAGLADYFEVDPVILRLAFVLLALLNGLGVVLYIVAWIIIPLPAEDSATPAPAATAADEGPAAPASPATDSGSAAPAQSAAADRAGGSEEGTTADRLARDVRVAGERVVEGLQRQAARPGGGRMAAGVILIGLGLVLLLERFGWFDWFDWSLVRDFWPLVLVVVGVLFILGAIREGWR